MALCQLYLRNAGASQFSTPFPHLYGCLVYLPHSAVCASLRLTAGLAALISSFALCVVIVVKKPRWINELDVEEAVLNAF